MSAVFRRFLGLLRPVLAQVGSNCSPETGTLRVPFSSTAREPEKMDKLVKNPFFNKYSAKLTEYQREKPEEFLKKVENTKSLKMKETLPEKAKEKTLSEILAKTPVYSKQVQLKDVMRLDLLEGRSAQEISDIWTTYHKGKDGYLSAVAPTTMYESIMQRSRQFPVFLFPLPRSGGYEFFLSEFQANQCYFTQLLSYQTRKADAPPCLSVVHFEDLKDQGVVLMRGEFDKNVLNPLEVQCLLNQMQLYYGTQDKEKISLLEKFHKNPDGFRYMDLISEVDRSFTTLK